MEILKKILLALAILILTPIIIFNQNIPAFIYNELEWRARANYLLAEQFSNDVEYLIGIRTGKEEVFISDEAKFDKLTEDIEKGLEIVGELLDDYQAYVNHQNKIPLLPAKYKKYHELKKPAFDNYQKGLRIFREIKAKEHKGFRLVRQLDIANQKFAGSREDISWEKHFQDMTDAYGVAKELINQAEELYKNNDIDEGFKSYIVLQCQKMVDFYEIITDPKNFAYSEATAKELEAIGQRGSEIDFNEVVTNWHREILDEPNKEMLEYKDLSYSQMEEADRYYRENDLKNDLVSRFLSIFSKSYPKNI